MNYLQVKIQSPRQVLFEGKALSVSSTNFEGKFDILPKHANFMTIIEDKPITVIIAGNQKLEFNFHQAIIVQSKDIVSIYADPQSSPLEQS